MSKLSILGLYQHDQSLFDNLQLPTAFTTDDRETLINNLLMDCAEFECVYPNFDFCKAAIGWWSKSRLQVWTKLYNSTMFVYNPIWNKDGTITETRSKEYSGESGKESELRKQDVTNRTTETWNNGESSKSETSSKDATTTKHSENDRTDNATVTHSATGDQDTETENKVAGFNSSTYVNKDKQTVDLSWSENGSESTEREIHDEGDETITLTESGSVSETGETSDYAKTKENGSVSGSGTTSETGTASGTESEEYVRTEQGNIGVTSTQQLIKEEREIALFEVDDFIINDFKRQFCILVY